jgi:hypothetical protein
VIEWVVNFKGVLLTFACASVSLRAS